MRLAVFEEVDVSNFLVSGVLDGMSEQFIDVFAMVVPNDAVALFVPNY